MLHSPHFRDAIGILCGRGHLLAITLGEGIYEADLQRALSESRYANGIDEEDRQDVKSVGKGITVTTEIRLLIENEKRRTALQNRAADLSRSAVFVTGQL